MKRDEIYKSIRQEIISGVKKEGEKLLTELEYSALFHVSRDTIRDAFKLLEKDGLIERIKAKGTFVKIPKISSQDRNISYLVPCYSYLRKSGIHNMNLMFELIAQAAIAGWRITPVIYSQTNDPADIWWENLAHFHSESRIIVNHSWFKPYFETLTSIGAKIAYLDNDCKLEKELEKHTCNWINFIEQDRVAAWKAFSYLRQQGCRKIAIFMPNINHPYNTIADEYRIFAQATGQEELLFPASKITENDFNSCKMETIISEAYRKYHFDGILCHCNELYIPMQNNIRTALGLPPDFPMVAIPSWVDHVYDAPNAPVPVVHYPLEKMAKDMIYHLTSGQYIKLKLFYEPTLRISGEEIPVIKNYNI
ncbi:MAG: GntR family transcriptional regulator [Lentisphaeria bacterium]|nr:GntR family transcriptional regulator [Lentisphaeria bacterium]